MSDTCECLKVIFPPWHDERAAYEMPLKGWISNVLIETPDGRRYPVSFIDPVRLQQDMEEYSKLGEPYFSEPGLIVLSEVTPDAIHKAVEGLWKRGYFTHLKSVTDNNTPEDRHGVNAHL